MENLHSEKPEENLNKSLEPVRDTSRLSILRSLMNLFRKLLPFAGFFVLLYLVFLSGSAFQSVLLFSKNGASLDSLSFYVKDFILLITAVGLSFVMLLHYAKIPAVSNILNKIFYSLNPLISPHSERIKDKVNIWHDSFKIATPKNRFLMLRVPLILLVVFYLASAFGNNFLPPKVVVTFPGTDGSGIALDTRIEIQFDKTVNKASVEKSFSISPQVSGKFDWSGESSVTFVPDKPLEIASSYTINLGSLVLSKLYIPKIKKDVINFDTVGNPIVVLASPQTEAPEQNTPITVMFDRPMVPLTTIQEKDKLAPAFVITPEIKGEGRWLGTSAYQFRPSETLKPATTYSYRVAAGLKSKDGGELKADAVYSFSTERPRILATSPVDNYNYASPTASVSATLNLKPDLSSSQKSIHVYKVDGDNRDEVSGSVRIYRNQIGFYPAKPLVRGSQYEAQIENGLKSIEGENGMNGTYVWRFKTAPLPGVTGSTPKNGDKDISEMYQLSVNFVSPMDEKSFKDNVVISPTPERKPSIYFYSYSGNNQLSIGTYLARSTAYTITIKGSVKDQYGVALGSDYTFSFTTAPYKPSISIQPTNTYFASFNQDVVPRIVSKVVNSNSVNYRLYKLKREDFLDLYRRVYIDSGMSRNLQNYDPNNLEKVREWSETFEADRNVPVNVITKVEKNLGEKIPSGLYFLDARIDSGAHDNLIMVVTKTALTLKTSPQQALVWAVDQTNGEVMPDVDIDLIRINGNSIKQGKTNSDGVFKTEVQIRSDRSNYSDYQNPIFAFTKRGDDEGVVIDNWGKGINNYEFGLQTYYDSQESDDYRANRNLKIHLLLDRPIYRPGQTVYFKGIVREDNDGQYRLVGDDNVQIKVFEAQNKEVFNQSVSLNSYGSFNGSFVLSSAGSVGNYRIEASISDNGFNQSFQVEEYKKPDYFVEVVSDKADYVDGAKVNISISSKFYFGSPLDHAPVTWTLSTEDSPYRWPKDTHFEFGDSDSYWYRPWWSYNQYSYYSGSKVTEGKGVTDGEGKLEVQLPINISQKNVNQIMRLEAVVKDLNSNQVIANSKEFVIHQANIQVGIKPQNYSGIANQESKVDLVTVGINGTELPGVPVKVSFYKRTWNYIKEEDKDTGEFYWTNKPNDVLITEANSISGDFGRTTVSFVPGDGGMFRAVAEAKDDNGRVSKSAIYIWVSGAGINVPRENHDRIVMVTDKDEYSIGETAKVVSVVPYQEMTGLITVERANVFDYKIVKTTPDNQSSDITIKDNYSPNAYVSGIFVKKGTSIKDPPQMKMGIVEVRVKNPKKQLNVSIKTNKDSYFPGEEMKLEVVTKDGSGQNVPAEVAIALVDEAVWSLARVSLADIYQTFYRPRNLAVITANDLTISMDRLNANVNLGSKGGSGGGGGGDGLDTLRDKFLDTAYWNANVETNSAGFAGLTVKLPDNLTTWRLMGVAATKDTAVGDITQKILVTKDVLIQPLLPRFLSVGDKPELGLVVHNNTSKDSTVTASIETKGVKVLESSQKDFNVFANTSKKIYWKTETEDVKEASIILKVKSKENNLSDSVKLTLPVVSYFTLEVVATSGEAKDTAEEKILIPGNVVAGQGKLNISLSATLGAGVTDAASFLLSYPYYCNEQIINRVIPAASLFDLANEANLDTIGGYNKGALENIVKDGIQRLVNTQRVDGGWGWWINNPSDPNLTAMIIDGLFYAKTLGFTVDTTVISKGENYLNQILAKADTDLEKQVYLATTVAKVGKVNQGLLSNLMDRRWQLTPIGRAYLLRALQEGGGLRQDQFRLMDELVSLAKKTNTTTHWEMTKRQWSFIGRDYAFTSIMLEALTKRNPKDTLIPETTRWLMQARRDGYWETTTETSAAVRAIVYMIKNRKEGNPNESWKILMGGKLIKEGSFTNGDLLAQISSEIPVSAIIKDQEVPVTINKSGSGSLYYNMNLKYYLPFTEVSPVEQGIVISREFVNREGQVLSDVKLTAGQELWVRLTVVAPTLINNVIVEDRLPAGLEAVNESLATTSMQDIKRLKVSEDSGSLYLDHSEIRDDRVALFANRLYQGIYEYTYRVRPTTPGVYHHPPADIYNMYIPDISGHSAGGWLEVAE